MWVRLTIQGDVDWQFKLRALITPAFIHFTWGMTDGAEGNTHISKRLTHGEIHSLLVVLITLKI